jgi:hypothetical protein
MNAQKLCWIPSLLIASVLGAAGQEFTNLGFETTTLTLVPGGATTRYTATLPGWSWNTVNWVDGDPNRVGFNDMALDAPAVTLHSSESPISPAVVGSYSVLLQGGTTAGALYGVAGASVYQTGTIPVDARRITYLGGSALVVTFNGQTLAAVALSGTPRFTTWAVDVSAYAGLAGELRFTAPWRTSSILDGIRFSPTPVPEPGGPLLFGGAAGGLLALLRLRRVRGRAGAV